MTLGLQSLEFLLGIPWRFVNLAWSDIKKMMMYDGNVSAWYEMLSWLHDVKSNTGDSHSFLQVI